ncbi:hypothetical protein [Legionella genomosp. 1]|uniref:hypothetical protein n=1 Tax=Legionella genomosp. 1 TaxID=1093625 RepID=UPI0010554335|nr:hypothetical protein [Legionella genomosp. 1]
MMKNILLDWLKSNQNEKIDFNDELNRLTIKPLNDFIIIKYWKPKQGRNMDLWRVISEIKITPEFLEECTNYDKLADDLYKKLLEGG